MDDLRETIPGLPWFTRKPEQAIFDELKFACAYALGPEKGRPLKIGWCGQPKDRITALQAGNWHPLRVHTIMWTLGWHMAQRIEAEAHRLLEAAGRTLGNGWFDITTEFGGPTLQVAADNLKIPFFSHDSLIDRVRQVRERRIAAQVRAAGV